MLVYNRPIINHDDPEDDMIDNGRRSSSSMNPEGQEDMTKPFKENAQDESDSDWQGNEDDKKVNGSEDGPSIKFSDPGNDTNPFSSDSIASNQNSGTAKSHNDINPFDEDESSHPPKITREDSNPFFDDNTESGDDTNPFAEDTNQVGDDTNPFAEAEEDDSNPFSENFTDEEQTLQITSSSQPMNSSKRVLTLDSSLSFSLEGVTTDESNVEEAELQSPASTSTNPFDDEEDGTNPFGEEGDGTNPFDDDQDGQHLPDEVFVNPEASHQHLHLVAFCGHSFEYLHQIGIHGVSHAFIYQCEP